MSDRKDWEYPFAAPNLEVQTDARLLAPGQFSQLTGVDGRDNGIIRRFPGFEHLETIDLTTPGYSGFDGDDLTRFWSFAIQLAPKSRTIVRGIIFITQDGGGEDVLASYTIREKDGTVTVDGVKPIVTLSGKDFVDLDVASDGQLLYITGRLDDDTPVEKLARYTLNSSTGTWAVADWDFDWLEVTGVQDHSLLSSFPTGYINSNQNGLVSYGITVRLVFPEQGYVLPAPDPFIWTPKLDDATSREVWGYFQESDLFRDQAAIEALGNVFTDCRLQVFRTIANRRTATQTEPADAEFAGRLFLEAEFVIPRHWTGSKRSYESNVQNADGFITQITDLATSASLFNVGQTIYVTGYTRIDTNDAAFRETNRIARFVYKRQISALTQNGADLEIDLDKPIPSGPATVTDDGSYWVSDENETEDTTHEFDLSLGSEGIVLASGSYMVTVGFKPATDDFIDADIVGDTPTGLSDNALTAQPELDTIDFSVFKDRLVPVTRRITEYDNLLVRATEPRADGKSSSPIESVSWSFPDRPGKGLISILTRRRITDLQRQVEAFVKAPPYLVVCLSNGFLRMHRNGSRMVVDDFHNRFGLQTGTTPLAIGTAVYAVSPHGLLVLDASSGEVNVIQSTAPYFRDTDRWRNNLANVDLGFDGEAGALVAYNRTLGEALILWSATGRMTHLSDLPYDRIISAPSLRAKGHEKLYWLLETDGTMYEIDSDRSAANKSTTLGDVAVNPLGGSTTSTAANKLIDSLATFDAALAGHMAFVRNSSSLKWNSAKITAVDSGTQLSLDADIALNIGEAYSLAVVPMKVQAWPVRQSEDDRLFDMFRYKKITHMGLVVTHWERDLLGGEATPAEDIQYQVYNRYNTAPQARASVTLSSQPTTNAETFANIEENGAVLMPGFEVYSHKTDIGFGGMIIQGWVDDSLRDEVNQSS